MGLMDELKNWVKGPEDIKTKSLEEMSDEEAKTKLSWGGVKFRGEKPSKEVQTAAALAGLAKHLPSKNGENPEIPAPEGAEAPGSEYKIPPEALNKAAELNKKGIPLATIALIVGIPLVILIAAMNLLGGDRRNCIGSISGAPECSDCEEVYKDTYVNNKYYGNCTAIPKTGNYADQCKLYCEP